MAKEKTEKEKVTKAQATKDKTKKEKVTNSSVARLSRQYREKIIPDLKKKLSFKSVMQVPRIEKIVINMGVGEAVGDKKLLESAIKDMQMIAGQKPVATLARKSVAGFKIRENYPIGCKVTLRKQKMYEFLDRLVSIAIPRIRDFRGVSSKFDGRGNFNMGIKEQIIFPEIEYDKVDKIRGMDINITTTAKNDADAKALLKSFNFPLRN